MKRTIAILLVAILAVNLLSACSSSGEPETRIKMPASSKDFEGTDYQEVVSQLRSAGFTNVTTAILDDLITGWLTSDGEVESVDVDGTTTFNSGTKYAPDVAIVVTYHTFPIKENTDGGETPTPEATLDVTQTDEPEPTATPKTETTSSEPETPRSLFYSTNDYDTAKKGNTGLFSYRERGGSYDIYWIIDFDEGYVYYFTTVDSSCDRVKIDSGTLNDAITITYHDGGDTWSYKLHFKYVNHPETLIMIDNDGFDYKYTTTDLDDALSLRNEKSIIDY